MSQSGCLWRKGPSWFLRYREKVVEEGKAVWKNRCVRLADYGDRYRRESDLEELVKEKMASIVAAAKCPQSSDLFVNYVENTYLPFVLKTKKASTYAGYRAYFKRYIKPWVDGVAVRDFTPAIVASVLKQAAKSHKMNQDTITKVRSILSGIFTFAISEGHFPAKSMNENPAHEVRIPQEYVSETKPTTAATHEQVRGILAALKAQPALELPALPLARAAVATIAMLGLRPGEARGLRWEDFDRVKQQVAVKRAMWHTIEGSPKTPQSVRFVAVSAELREMLLSLWKEQGSPIGGYILAAPEKKDKPVILDNLAKRTIRPRIEAVNADAASRGEKAELVWPDWYSLRRFHGTAVRAESDLETTCRALGNSKAVADKHYVKPDGVLPDVRKAVNGAVSGLIQ